MPHSLKSKVKSLCYKGEITEKERDRIIHALEQQSSEDCISREDAKNLFWDGTEGYDCRGFTRMEIGEMLDDLPSVTPKTRWIPCSERLPEKDENVLTYHRNESFDYQYVSWIDDYSGKWAGFIGNLSDEVLAWMPLPSPWEGE